MKKAICLTLLALGCHGCGSVLMEMSGVSPDMATAIEQGNYAKLADATEARYGGLDKIPMKHAPLGRHCTTLYYARRYDKLEACLSELEKHRKEEFGADMVYGSIPKPCVHTGINGGWYCIGYGYELWLKALYALDTGDFGRAIQNAEILDRLYPNWQNSATQIIASLGILTIASALNGDRQVARKYLTRLEKFKTPFMGSLPNVETPQRIWLVRSYMALGDYARAYRLIGGTKARETFSAALTVGVTNLFLAGAARVDYSTSNEAIALAYLQHKAELETGRVAEAEEGFDKMLAQPAVRANGDLAWLVLYDRGRIAERMKALSQAVKFYAEAVDIIEAQRATLGSETSKIGFVGSRQNVYRALIRVLMQQGDATGAFQYVERSKARALVDMLAGKADFAAPEADTEHVRELLATAEATESTAKVVDGNDWVRKRSLVIKAHHDLVNQAPELASLVTVDVAGASEIQQGLSAEETLVEYYYSGDVLFAFVVTRDGIDGISLSAEKLDEDVQTLRKSIQALDPRWKADAQRLHRRLIDPLRPYLSSNNITIVPHGALHYLPFNALHDGSHFLIEKRSIRLLPAATVLKFLKAPTGNKPGTLLAFGNPDLKDPRYDLAFAQAETQSIVRVLPRSRALTRGEATKTAFKRYANDFRMLHVASHGEFDPDRPLASSLLLAPDAGGDGRLTVSDLYGMRFDADLVTLSACETGLGKIANGDDVVGLTRGFLYAGARTIVASLWQVDDKATGELMMAFYASLAKGMGKREALRSAQLGFLRRQPEPFFWAAFQLTGNP